MCVCVCVCVCLCVCNCWLSAMKNHKAGLGEGDLGCAGHCCFGGADRERLSQEMAFE